MKHFNSFPLTPPRHGLIGHRGLCGIAPENTLASFSEALKSGLNWIELDVRLSKDKELICIHDNRIERTTPNMGFVKDYTQLELKNMDAGSWFHERYANEGIPSLADIIDLTKDTGTQINIEIKTPNPPSVARLHLIADKLLNIISNWPDSLPPPLISCFDWTVLNRIRQACTNTTLGYLSELCSEQIIMEISQLENCSLHCNAQTLTPDLVQIAISHNVPLLAYTVNDVDLANDLLGQGVFGIFSDYPLHQQCEKLTQKAS